MHITLLTEPAGTLANEDAVGVLGDTAVLLDGSGVPPRFRAGCAHPVAWYSHALAARLLQHAQDPRVTLREVLARGIAEVRALHEDTCDLERGGPSATVAMLRRRSDPPVPAGAPHLGDVLEYLVLCDAALLVQAADGTARRLTDLRIERVVAEEEGRVPGSGPEGDAEAIEARRNAPGGFWVARHEERAAEEALTGTLALAGLEAVHLVSDGITRAVDLLGRYEDATLARALSESPHSLVEALRVAEEALPPHRRPRKVHDDASVITLHLGTAAKSLPERDREEADETGINRT